LFWLIGLQAAERVVNNSNMEVALVEESDEQRFANESNPTSPKAAESTVTLNAPATQ
jgi:hypothetical protein